MQSFLETKDTILNKIIDFFSLFYYKPKYFFINIKFKLKNFWQRGKYGFAESDSWEIDNWFSTVFPKIIRNLKNNCHGYPGKFIYDKNNNIISEKEAIEKWKSILERIAFCLEESDPEKSTYKGLNNVYNENDWMKKQRELMKYRNNMKNEAFDLIKEYYWDLWD